MSDNNMNTKKRMNLFCEQVTPTSDPKQKSLTQLHYTKDELTNTFSEITR
ncbi:hypothetical protein [Carboxylicivirga sp. N1Y90]|nr:hypothetical protein [Marinilabiliaceae bacterium N1Y90]